jgi:multimeric flavodoxin WrbA
MTVLYISGSPRKKSNTDYILKYLLKLNHGEFIKLTDYNIEPCNSCWACLKNGACIINDDMESIIIPKILDANVLVIGTPVYFNNITA